jgi:23S rRNA pseudouridine1911/1915/1917 synthase
MRSTPQNPTILTVAESLPLERLDTFLREKFPEVSRGTIQRLLAEGHIQVDGRQVKPTHHPRAAEIISIRWPEPRAALAQPEDIPLDILYEDESLLAINKPPGLVVHPAAGHQEHTLVNALLHHCAGKLSGIGGVARPGIVHRLDKDTSGCLVVAKNDVAHLRLTEQFARREVEKIYEAIVCGAPARDSGEIKEAIARHPTQRKRMAIPATGGREAWTSYRVLRRLNGISQVEMKLHTGRTHQIRVHLEHLGCPVVGDVVYGARQNRRLKETTGYSAPRQLLHAKKLSLIHPVTQERITFEAPLPEDFAVAVQFFAIKSER